MGETEQATTGAASSSGRWKTWVLVLSLALNLFVVAIVAGAALRHPRMPHDGGVRDVGFGPYTSALSPEDRLALRRAFLAAAPDFREKRRMLREDVVRLAASLRAEPWDAAATEAILARQGVDLTERMQLGRRLFLERLAEMSPEARTALAARIEGAARDGARNRKQDGDRRRSTEPGR